jgi:hypothetical protein
MTTENAALLGSVTARFDISVEGALNLLCSAFEGGSNYFIDHVEVVLGARTRDEVKAWGEAQGLDWQVLYLAAVHPDTHLVVHIDEPFLDGGPTAFTLCRNILLAGFQKLATYKQPRHWAAFIDEDADAETGDVLLQLAIFGELVFS